jgi:hypothetical protein
MHPTGSAGVQQGFPALSWHDGRMAMHTHKVKLFLPPEAKASGYSFQKAC